MIVNMEGMNNRRIDLVKTKNRKNPGKGGNFAFIAKEGHCMTTRGLMRCGCVVQPRDSRLHLLFVFSETIRAKMNSWINYISNIRGNIQIAGVNVQLDWVERRDCCAEQSRLCHLALKKCINSATTWKDLKDSNGFLEGYISP